MKDRDLVNRFMELKETTQSLEFDNEAKKDKIKKSLEMLIRNKFGNQSHYLEDLLDPEFYYHPSVWTIGDDYSKENRESWEAGKQKWCNLIETMIEDIQCFPSEKVITKPFNIQENEQRKNKKIFIVHGHDNEMVHASARLITNLGLEPIILRELPNQGRTVIEKFEDYADVSFAIVLFSPDDVGKATEEDVLKPRPRQNVVFELGFFIGKLGRDKVVVLHKMIANFEMLSDFQGVIFEPYENGWEFKIAKEIKSAGFEVDLNKLF